MNKEIVIVGLIALVIGGVGGYSLGNHGSPQRISEGNTVSGMHHDMQTEMDGMMQGLDGKTGDDFDKAFLSGMITHHQGAVEMAEAALKDAKHQEIKDLAKNIISAQNTEIKEMQDWQKAWYGQ